MVIVGITGVVGNHNIRLEVVFNTGGITPEDIGGCQLGALGDDEVSQAFKKAAMQAVYRYVQLNFEYEQACSVLEKAKRKTNREISCGI